MISKIICAYISTLSTSGCTNPYFFIFIQLCRLGPLKFRRPLARILGFPKSLEGPLVWGWCQIFYLSSFHFVLRHSLLSYSWRNCCKPYMALWICIEGYARILYFHLDCLMLDDFIRLNSYVLIMLTKREYYVSFLW